jgi:hypothetical protein
MDRLNYHSKRAMQEFHAGIEAANREASEAHLRLSALHMEHVDALAQRPLSNAGPCAVGRRG